MQHDAAWCTPKAVGSVYWVQCKGGTLRSRQQGPWCGELPVEHRAHRSRWTSSHPFPSPSTAWLGLQRWRGGVEGSTARAAQEFLLVEAGVCPACRTDKWSTAQPTSCPKRVLWCFMYLHTIWYIYIYMYWWWLWWWFDWLIDWLTDWMIDWLTDWLIDR